MKKQYFLVLDTETATVPFINDYPATDKERKNIAIAKPLVYDIGWIIIDRKGIIIETANYLVQETFFVPPFLILPIIGKRGLVTWRCIMASRLKAQTGKLSLKN